MNLFNPISKVNAGILPSINSLTSGVEQDSGSIFDKLAPNKGLKDILFPTVDKDSIFLQKPGLNLPLPPKPGLNLPFLK